MLFIFGDDALVTSWLWKQVFARKFGWNDTHPFDLVESFAVSTAEKAELAFELIRY